SFEQRAWMLEQRGAIAGLALYPQNLLASYQLAISRQKATISMPQVARARGDNTGISVSGTGTIGPVDIRLTADRGSSKFSTTRVLPETSATRTLEGRLRHKSTGMSADVMVPLSLAGIAITPRLGLKRTRVKSEGYTEHGQDDLALTVEPSSMTLKQIMAGSDVTFPAFRLGSVEAGATLRLMMIRNRNGQARLNSSLAEPETGFMTMTQFPERETRIGLGLTFSGHDQRLQGHLGVVYSRSGGGGSTRALQLATSYSF
ncbi:MAG: autotransporter domain-containing protein, partial [Rhodobacteraceae bacterium]|nr:autotransporter domain-containing protein [Paracoccaceae bacterium]